MGKRRTRKLSGITNFHDEAEQTTMLSREEMEVSADRVEVRIGKLGTTGGERTIASEHPAVIRHTNELIAARKAHEYRYALVTPNPKPPKASPHWITCPTCSGTGEEDTGMRLQRCRQCHGARKVPTQTHGQDGNRRVK